MTERMDLFIVEEARRAVGFFALKRINDETAEVPLLYLARPAQGRGIGGLRIQFIEDRIARRWASVETLFVDTIVPEVTRTPVLVHFGSNFLGPLLCCVDFEHIDDQKLALAVQDKSEIR